MIGLRARENVSDQVPIGLKFASDWLSEKVTRVSFGQSHSRLHGALLQSWIILDTELNETSSLFVPLFLLGDAEWAQLSEQERQKRLVKLKLEERRLRKEGQLDELHRLLGEGFEMDANLRKLMGENRARWV